MTQSNIVATLSLDFDLTPRAQSFVNFLKTLEPRSEAPEVRTEAQQTPASTAHTPLATFPRIGDEWPEKQGIYAGIARGFDGEPDAHLVLLHDVPKEEMNWADAQDWAAALGNGAHVPTRFESALLYANLRDQFKTDGWYWTGTQSSGYLAFGQHFSFGIGTQYGSLKTYEARVRAVRLIQL